VILLSNYFIEFGSFAGCAVILLSDEKDNYNVLRSSVRLVTRNFDLHQIACLQTKNNTTYDAEHNAITLQEDNLICYGIELVAYVNYMTSDTASVARAVSNYVEDIDQVDCEMYVVSFGIIVCNWFEKK
jgi:hypothetical protein